MKLSVQNALRIVITDVFRKTMNGSREMSRSRFKVHSFLTFFIVMRDGSFQFKEGAEENHQVTFWVNSQYEFKLAYLFLFACDIPDMTC